MKTLTFFNKIKNLSKNKDYRVVLENFISLSSLHVVGMLLPLITLPYVLRVFGYEKYGIIVFAASLVAYFESVTDYSFNITATRDVAIFKDSPKKLSVIYSRVLIIKGLFLIISLLTIYLLVTISPFFNKERNLYLITATILIGHSLFPVWFFQGIEKMKYITYLDLGIKAIFTICIFIFINDEEDYWFYPLFNSAGNFLGGIVGQLILTRKYKLHFYFLKYRGIIRSIKENFPIFLNRFLPTLYNNTNTFLLGFFTSSDIVGIYAAIKKITDIAIKLLGIISRVFFPLINRKRNTFKTYQRIKIGIATLLVITILVFNKIVFLYLNLTYSNSTIILFILTLGVFGITFYDIWGLNYLIVRRYDKIVMNNTLKAALVGFIFAFPLTYYFGIIGAAINLTLSRVIMGGGVYFIYKKKSKKTI